MRGAVLGYWREKKKTGQSYDVFGTQNKTLHFSRSGHLVATPSRLTGSRTKAIPRHVIVNVTLCVLSLSVISDVLVRLHVAQKDYGKTNRKLEGRPESVACSIFIAINVFSQFHGAVLFILKLTHSRYHFKRWNFITTMYAARKIKVYYYNRKFLSRGCSFIPIYGKKWSFNRLVNRFSRLTKHNPNNEPYPKNNAAAAHGEPIRTGASDSCNAALTVK